mgnify:CR=1 FL=1
MVKKAYKATVLPPDASMSDAQKASAPATATPAPPPPLSNDSGGVPGNAFQRLAEANSKSAEDPAGPNHHAEMAKATRSRINRFKLLSVITSCLVKAGYTDDQVSEHTQSVAEKISDIADRLADKMGESGKPVWVRRILQVAVADLFASIYRSQEQDIEQVLDIVEQTTTKTFSLVDTRHIEGAEIPSPTVIDPVVAIRLTLTRSMAPVQAAIDRFPYYKEIFGIEPQELMKRLTEMVMTVSIELANELAAGGSPDDLLISRQSVIGNMTRVLPDMLKFFTQSALDRVKKDPEYRAEVRRNGLDIEPLNMDFRRHGQALLGSVTAVDMPR